MGAEGTLGTVTPALVIAGQVGLSLAAAVRVGRPLWSVGLLMVFALTDLLWVAAALAAGDGDDGPGNALIAVLVLDGALLCLATAIRAAWPLAVVVACTLPVLIWGGQDELGATLTVASVVYSLGALLAILRGPGAGARATSGGPAQP